MMKSKRFSFVLDIHWISNVLTLILGVCSISNRDFCHDGPTTNIYLVLGEKGYISHENLPQIKSNKTTQPLQCQVQIITCSTCVIQLKISNLTISPNENIDQLLCNYVQIYEHKRLILTYTSNNASTYTDLSFRSQTRYLTMSFSNYRVSGHTFSIEYRAERNVNYFQGVPGEQNITFGGTISSPYFPSYFPRDIGVEYVISCQQRDISCRIKLLFTDFLVPEDSLFQFFEWTGRKIRVRYGIMPRPPVIVSSGPSLLVRFFANGATGLGYKANYYFVTGKPEDNSLFPITDCGGEIENVGGGITMLNMVEGDEDKTYDCIWIIKPYKNYLANKLNLFLKVISFKNFSSAELNIYEGQTSSGKLIETLNSSMVTKSEAHIAHGSLGFYIYLQAVFNNASNLAISYATFSQKVCYLGPEFRCENKKCISRQLYCDGFDHCGDNSDEPDVCSKEWQTEPSDRSWYAHIPNYYFPRVDRYIDIKSATLFFTLSSIGLVFVIGGLVALLYRMGIRARHQRERHSRLHAITDVEEVHVVVQDDPPNYEAPPSYDDITNHQKSKNSLNCEKCHQLEVNLPRSTTPDSPPPPYSKKIGKEVNESTSLMANKIRSKLSLFTGDPSPSSSMKASTSNESGDNSFAPGIKQLYDFHLLWSIFPRRVNKVDPVVECDCEGACSCATISKRTQRVETISTPATWSPGTSKLEAINLHFENSKDKNEFKNKKHRNLKRSASADNLFNMK